MRSNRGAGAIIPTAYASGAGESVKRLREVYGTYAQKTLGEVIFD